MDLEKISIDSQACILCGKCIEVCGSMTLEIIDDRVVQTMPELCSSCGHCAIVCPTNCIKSNENSIHKFEIKELDNNLSDIEKLLLTKRSVRKFKEKNIDKNILKKIIYYGNKAPSSSNLRKRNYIIVDNREKIIEIEKIILKKYENLLKILNPLLLGIIKIFNKEMYYNLKNTRLDILQMQKQFGRQEYPIFRNAPAVIIIYAPKDLQTKDDCVISQQYMMLYAHSQGIASCIIGYAQWAHKTLEKYFKLPKKHQIYAVSTFGYAKYPMKKAVEYPAEKN
jgi:nitroreductase/NAD-dependent dihydropyrimidine dehydrogenase PreA subunit